jgi:hypothetical protein
MRRHRMRGATSVAISLPEFAEHRACLPEAVEVFGDYDVVDGARRDQTRQAVDRRRRRRLQVTPEVDVVVNEPFTPQACHRVASFRQRFASRATGRPGQLGREGDESAGES